MATNNLRKLVHRRILLTQIQSRCFSSQDDPPRSSLFGQKPAKFSMKVDDEEATTLNQQRYNIYDTKPGVTQDAVKSSQDVHQQKRSNLFQQNMYGQIVEKHQTKQASDQEQGRQQSVRSDVVYSYDLEEVLSVLKKTAIQSGKNGSNEFYSACLDRLDILITERNSKVGKNEVAKILRELAYFRPREYDREEQKRIDSGNFTQSEMQDDVLSVRHKQLIQKNQQKFQTLPGHVFGFLYENINKNLLKDMFTQFDDEQESKTSKSLFDVMALYIQIYSNLQVRVMDMLAQDLFTAQEALDIMVSYSIAEEGSNNMFIQLIQTMLSKRDPAGYDMVEIEMILNYFPHSVWSTEDDLKPLRDKFYYPILYGVRDNILKMDNRQFVSTFQGMTLAGPKIFTEEILNVYLNQYVRRIKPQEGSKLSHKEVYQFLELLIQYLKLNRGLMESIDSSQLMKLSCDLYLIDSCTQMSCSQISGLYWLCANLGPYWDQNMVYKAETRLLEFLREEIETQKKYEEDYDADVPEGLITISLNDLLFIERCYQNDQGLASCSIQQNAIFQLISQCKTWDMPEKERKWFHY